MKIEQSTHFDFVKSMNRRILRNLLRTESPMSISKAASKAGLSYPTASALFKELVSSKEALISQKQDVAGGRPGICYELNPSYQYGLIAYFDEWSLKTELVNYYGETISKASMEHLTSDLKPSEIIDFISKIKQDYPTLSALSLGIPGAVHETEIRHLPKFPKLQGRELAEKLNRYLQLDISIENDTNAIALSEVERWNDFAHIIYVDSDHCIGVAISQQGQILKGCTGCAGEMDPLISDMENPEEIFTAAILILTCVLDLPTILISGTHCSEECVPAIQKNLLHRLPADRLPDIHFIQHMEGAYVEGLRKRILSSWSEQV